MPINLLVTEVFYCLHSTVIYIASGKVGISLMFGLCTTLSNTVLRRYNAALDLTNYIVEDEVNFMRQECKAAKVLQA